MAVTVAVHFLAVVPERHGTLPVSSGPLGGTSVLIDIVDRVTRVVGHRLFSSLLFFIYVCILNVLLHGCLSPSRCYVTVRR